MRILFDMASVIQTGLRKGNSDEYIEVEHNGKKEKFFPAEHGYENAVAYMVDVIDRYSLHPSNIIMVFEGRDTKKRRTQIMATYKGDREKSHPQYYEEYNRCKDMVKTAFKQVGALAVTQDLAEGDDTLKYLANLMDEDVIVVSNDGDLTALAGRSAKGHKIDVVAGQDTNKLPEGVFEAKHIHLYKSLVGDPGDKIPGIKGFGAKAWESLIAIYGADGVNEISAAVGANDKDKIFKYATANSCKILTKIVENWNDVQVCWRVSDIYADWVDTRYYPLQWEAGMVHPKGADERLHKYAQVAVLVTADNYDDAMRRLKAARAKYPLLPVSFDLETSTSEDSDDWMEAQGRPDGVDPISSYLVGFSLSFGPGGRFTYYVSVKHHATNNITMQQARLMIEEIHPVLKPIHNTSFELTVLYNDYAKDEDGTLWRDLWRDRGEFGFLPNIEDTLFMASYVDENSPQRNLKYLSRNVLGYDQVDFNTMRTFRLDSEMQIRWEKAMGSGGKEKLVPRSYHEANPAKPWPGGRLITRVEKVDRIDPDTGKPMLDAKGKVKQQAVTVEIQGREPDGSLSFKRARNKVTGLMENVPRMEKVQKTYLEVRYKMHEMPAEAVFTYGTDDAVCTMAYWVFAKTHMLVDEHYHVYREVEIDAAYQHVKNYVDGFPIAIHELVKQRNSDMQVLREAESTLHSYLIGKGWAGTVQTVYGADITAQQIKEAYATVFKIVEEDEDEESEVEPDAIMTSRTKLPAKYVPLIMSQDREGAETFGWHLQQLLEEGEVDQFNAYIAEHFDGKPRFSYGNKDMSRLLYEVMGMTVRVRNKPTAKMKAEGIREGTPKADALAVAYAIAEATAGGEAKAEELKVLKAMQLITTVNTRNSLFYATYPGFVHWESGKVHSSHRQCHANTRRASSAAPNMQQLPVHAKIKGFESPFRRVVRPHKPGAVVVSLDFNAQELRAIADDSQDPNMLACYVGENKKDMHSITGAGIALRKIPEKITPIMEALREQYSNKDDLTYYAFKTFATTEEKLFNEFRGLGKKVNFTTEYGAQAPKLAATLMVEEDEAQSFIDAREEAFHVAAKWKSEKLVQVAREKGYIRSRKGAKRHLREMLDSRDRYIASKAERQAVNFRIQGSCAEQTKLAEGRMWRQGLFADGRFDAVCYGPVHDEVVASVMLEDLLEFLPLMHAAMVAPYADMQVPVVSSIAFGPNFYDQVEIGEVPTKEAIEQGIKTMLEKYGELV